MSNLMQKNDPQPLGFLKTTDGEGAALSAQQKALLNRRGNELFNVGDVETARRIFMATGYSDGLTRVGDHYIKENRAVDALKMYWAAHNRRQAEPIIENISAVISAVLSGDDEQNG